jgi:hypothetical protein
MAGPKKIRVAGIEIAHPGYPVMSGELAYPLGDLPPTLDETAIQLHELVNDLIMAIRKAGPL